jgi:hypothetical protein
MTGLLCTSQTKNLQATPEDFLQRQIICDKIKEHNILTAELL